MRSGFRNKLIVCALLAVMSCFNVANAGDLPGARKAPPQGASTPAIAQWSGIYGGLHLGYGFGRSRSADIDGFVGGGQVGINFQTGQLVYGGELDLAYSGVDFRAFTETFRQKWIGSGRLRLGYAFERFMPFVTGGLAYSTGELKAGGGKDDNTHLGYVIGIGAEMMVTEKVSANIQFLHYRFGAETYNVLPTARSINIVTNQLHIGMNYRF